jgi:hypothetical protein
MDDKTAKWATHSETSPLETAVNLLKRYEATLSVISH